MTHYKDPEFMLKDGWKRCKICLLNKPIAAYSKEPKSHDRHRSRCKDCVNSAARKTHKRSPGYIAPRNKTKECKQCGIVKAFDRFHKMHNALDGLNSTCMVCTKKLYSPKVLCSGWGYERREQVRKLHESRMRFTDAP